MILKFVGYVELDFATLQHKTDIPARDPRFYCFNQIGFQCTPFYRGFITHMSATE